VWAESGWSELLREICGGGMWVGVCCIAFVAVAVAAAAAATSNDRLVTNSFTRQFSNLQQIFCYKIT